MAMANEQGYCFGIGGTNSRQAFIDNGEVMNFRLVPTPQGTTEFFTMVARGLLAAADAGAGWAVVGVPGPVEAADHDYAISCTNVPSLTTPRRLKRELSRADPAAGRLLSEGFGVVAVNDGELAAQAAARCFAEGRYDRVAAVIIGTGVGGAVVVRDQRQLERFRPLDLPFEIGHVAVGDNPLDDFESRIAGPAILRRTNRTSEELPAEHPLWGEVGRSIGRRATLLSLVSGAELVVPTGGVGVGGYDKYEADLQAFLDGSRYFGNDVQRRLTADIRRVPAKEAQVFELYGARGVILNHQPVMPAVVQSREPEYP